MATKHRKKNSEIRYPRMLGTKRHPLYQVWDGVRQRKQPLCAPWKDFDTFADWAMAQGWEPGLFVVAKDRDCELHPINCRLGTKTELKRQAGRGMRHRRVIDGKVTSLYCTWQQMKQRCENPKATGFSRYGGRGIRVCQAWQDFDSFADWMLANGWESGLTIDRIDGRVGYSPRNCQILARSANCAKTTTTTDKILSNRRNAELAKAKNSKPVRCLGTGEVFKSASVVARMIGAHQASISRAVRTGKPYKGNHYEFV